VVIATEFGFAFDENGEPVGCPAAFEVAHHAHPSRDIFMGRKKRAAGPAEVLEIPSGPDWLGPRFNACGPLGD
jgi:hypothetical protein